MEKKRIYPDPNQTNEALSEFPILWGPEKTDIGEVTAYGTKCGMLLRIEHNSDSNPDALGEIVRAIRGAPQLHDKKAGKPKYEVGQRVCKRAEDQRGRVQAVTYETGGFRYMVKWDVGPTTSHLESDIHDAPLPPHYP